MKKLLIILALLTIGCNSTKMILTDYGYVHRFQIEGIEKVRKENKAFCEPQRKKDKVLP